MSIGFFVIGAVIFAIYMFFTIWNILYSNKKQRDENYPNIDKKEKSE
jgi:phosphotransferase system  glucose/maltose/N-acetylglucosamine-specific IIC component